MTHEQEKKIVMKFLDTLDTIQSRPNNHINEKPSWLIHVNFGISHGMALEYVRDWKFNKRLDAAVGKLMDREMGVRS
jgi:hypothetical protein